MLNCTLTAMRVNQTIKAEEVYQMLDGVQMHILKENIEKKLSITLEERRTRGPFAKPLEADEKLNECFDFDMGHYPMTLWLNNSDDKLVQDMRKYTFFLPPKPSKDLFAVTAGECSTEFEFQPIVEPQLLRDSAVKIEEFEGCIQRINAVVGPLRSKHSFQERLILFYILIGLLAVTPLSVVLGINYSYLYPVFLTILYFLGFIYLIMRV
jgi:hypothetical protein